MRARTRYGWGRIVDLMATVDRTALIALCERWHIRALSVFGSVATGQDRPDSDLDLLVVFEPEMNPGLDFVTVEDELAEVFGRAVDLRTPGDLSRHFRDEVVRTAVPLYGRTGQGQADPHAGRGTDRHPPVR